MNRLLFVLPVLCVLVLASCMRPEKPTFKGVQNVKIEVADGQRMIVNGDAVFHNPNNSELHLKKTDIKLFMEGKEVGVVKEDIEKVIPANGDFTVPVNLDMAVDQLFDNPLDMMGNMLSILGGKKMEVTYTGTITVEVLGMELDVPVDHTEDVALVSNK